MNEAELGPLAFWVVSAFGLLSGFLSMWAFRRWSNPARLRSAINKIVAHLLEFRLYSDEPALLMRAQRDLLVANGLFLRALIGPSLLLAVPFSFLVLGLHGAFARAPLQLEKPAILTVQCRSSKLSTPTLQLIAPDGIEVETPPLRLLTNTQICWRLRPHKIVDGVLTIRSDNRLITKSVSSGGRSLQCLSPMRAGSLIGFLSDPFEEPFTNPDISSVALNYPPALILGHSWLLWYSLALLVGAASYVLALR